MRSEILKGINERHVVGVELSGIPVVERNFGIIASQHDDHNVYQKELEYFD